MSSSHLTTLVDQSYFTVPSFTLECGVELQEVPVAYKTWGTLNETKDNVMIICHAFTGSADVEDWWGPLIGVSKAFDPKRFFIFCANVLGSPYGTASPITINPITSKPYGPEFPPTTIRDDVRLHKLVLDSLGINSVAVVIGGSMGGMAVLEWPLCSPPGYVKHIIPLATSARHSAWCISWGEAQRQSIYSDPGYYDGYYHRVSGTQPSSGLAAARMSALLTYRSRDSFESRFGRNSQATPPRTPLCKPTPDDVALGVHNDGHKQFSRSSTASQPPSIFTAQSYLRYQGDKFISRFDANCYIHITRKLDTHDISRGRPTSVAETLATIPSGALVIGIATDGLFTTTEQREIAEHIPDAELVIIESPDGHDGFLLEFESINTHILRFLHKEFPEIYAVPIETSEQSEGFAVKKTSLFGEAEADITHW